MTTTDELFSAITNGDTGQIEQILREQPDLADTSRDGVSPLRAAAYAGHADLAVHLEELGARPDAFDAAALGEVDRLRDLIDEDPALASAVAGDGFTPLHLASWFGHAEVAGLLLGKGA